MQIAARDFLRSMRDLDGVHDPVAICDHGSSGRACPCCGEVMATCSLAIGTLRLACDQMMWCGEHGLWMPRAAITDAYARATRRRRLGSQGDFAWCVVDRSEEHEALAALPFPAPQQEQSVGLWLRRLFDR